jgi:hypothetical protein
MQARAQVSAAGPPSRPRARTAARLAWVRSRIGSRPNAAGAAKPRARRGAPAGVVLARPRVTRVR